MVDLVILTTAGVGTWLLRASGVVLLSDRALPVLLERGLEEARPSVLAALLMITLTGERGTAGLPTLSPLVVAAAITALIAWRTGGMLRTIAAGIGFASALSLFWP